MKTPLLSRRTLLRGAGVSIALPWLEAMSARPALAAGPKRVVFFNTMNGTIKPNWTPMGTESTFTLSTILAPLEPYKDKLLILDGLDNVAATKGDGDDHMRGMGSCLTGIANANGPTGGGISLDQHIANNLVAQGFKGVKSLELGVSVALFGSVLCYTAYSGAGQPIPHESNPGKVFDRIFKNFTPPAAGSTGPDPAVENLRLNRKSVLDRALKAYEDLKPKLGKADQAKLDAHLQQIRDLENRVTTTAGSGSSGPAAGCMVPTRYAGAVNNDAVPMTMQAQLDVAAMALRCDLTRVVNLQVSQSAGDIRYTWLGQSRGHHEMSHDPDSNAQTMTDLTNINVWLAKQLASFLGQLQATPEGDGTMLDNTLVLWSNELSKGNNHSHPDMPFVLAGGKNLGLRTGRFLRYTNTVPHNKLLVSVMNAMGVQGTTFGDANISSGPLDGLT